MISHSNFFQFAQVHGFFGIVDVYLGSLEETSPLPDHIFKLGFLIVGVIFHNKFCHQESIILTEEIVGHAFKVSDIGYTTVLHFDIREIGYHGVYFYLVDYPQMVVEEE